MFSNGNESWSAWLIEGPDDTGPTYARFGEAGVEWTKDPLAACHFVRREDAEQMAFGEDCMAVREHEFVGTTGNEGL